MDYFRVEKRIHEGDIMKLKAIRSKYPQDWGEFQQLRNKVNSNIKIAKESCYTNLYLAKVTPPLLKN